MYATVINALPFMILIIGCCIASYTDIRTRRIPHTIPIGMMVLALPLQLTHGFLVAGEAFLIGLAILFGGTLLYSLGWMGGGDIKLLAAGAFLLGPHSALQFILYSLIAGGVLAVITLILRKQSISYFGGLLARLQQQPNPKQLIQIPSGIALPYALAIAAGAVTSAFITFIPVAQRIT